jgi:hypothetical protein
MIKDFWQQYPGELNINGNMLTASFFADRAVGNAFDTSAPVLSGTRYIRGNSLYFTRQGGAKTYQMRLSLASAAPLSVDLTSLNDNYQRHSLDLVATPDWYTASGVYGDLTPGDSDVASSGYDAYLMHDIYLASSGDESDPTKTGTLAAMYGWRDYGNRLHAGWADVSNGVRIPGFFNDTHVGANNFLTDFLRTGDQRWFKFGEVSTRNFMDIDVSHAPRQGYWNTAGIPQPAGELLASGHDNIDQEVRNLHWGHSHVSGLSDLYLLTGDKRSFEVLGEMANWWKFVTPYFFTTPFDQTRYREAERDYGWPLYVMNEYVRVTGDANYFRTVNAQLVNYLIQWWKTPLKHYGWNPATQTIVDDTSWVSNDNSPETAPAIGVNDYTKGTGYWTMRRMDNGGPCNRCTGANPWMAGALIDNVIKFYEQDKQFAASGNASGVSQSDVKEMLFQTMNYVVKHGYDATQHWFVYSEVVRGYTPGDNHVIYGLAYLSRLYQQEFALGHITHPEWYDTESTWMPIATDHYNSLKNTVLGTNVQSSGFYGYETVYPADFFKIMKDALGY